MKFIALGLITLLGAIGCSEVTEGNKAEHAASSARTEQYNFERYMIGNAAYFYDQATHICYVLEYFKGGQQWLPVECTDGVMNKIRERDELLKK